METGKIPLEFVIKTRRITYLHHLLTRDTGEMLYRVFEAQVENPVKNDWIIQVEDDLTSFDIPKDFDFIRSFKRLKFKEYVKEKAKYAAFEALLKLKENHSKVQKLSYSTLKLQDYLFDRQITVNQARIVFKSRTRMNRYYVNFKGKHNSMLTYCPVCLDKETEDSQEHSLNCENIIQALDVRLKCEDIFMKVTPNLAAGLEKIEKYREKYLI